MSDACSSSAVVGGGMLLPNIYGNSARSTFTVTDILISTGVKEFWLTLYHKQFMLFHVKSNLRKSLRYRDSPHHTSQRDPLGKFPILS